MGTILVLIGLRANPIPARKVLFTPFALPRRGFGCGWKQVLLC